MKMKFLLTGRWIYNEPTPSTLVLKKNFKKDEKIILKQKEGYEKIYNEILTPIRENSNLNTTLESPPPTKGVEIPLEVFHNFLRANDVLNSNVIGLHQRSTGLVCFSKYMKEYRLNNHNYKKDKLVHINPASLCKITRKLKNRDKTYTCMGLNDKYVSIHCELPWIDLTITEPTVTVKEMI